MATSDIKRASRKGRPNYPIDFKRSVAALACVPGISVAKLALKHGVNANLIFKWRRHYQAGRFGAQLSEHGLIGDVADGTAPELLPVLMRRQTQADRAQGTPPEPIEIVLSNATVRVRGEVSRGALLTVLDCLAERT